MTIDEIKLENVLPRVFAGQEREKPVCDSQVWLRDIAFRRGECYMVEAESGTGKSSLCSFIFGNRSDYNGRILYDGTDIRTFGIDRWCEVRRSGVAILPQEMRLFPELTAMENVQIKNRLTNHLTDEEIERMFDLLEIGKKKDVAAAKMSIGQQQRVAIIRAVAQPFSFLLLDEPVSHLDRRNNITVARLLLEHAQRQQASIITTSVGNPLLLEAPINHISL